MLSWIYNSFLKVIVFVIFNALLNRCCWFLLILLLHYSKAEWIVCCLYFIVFLQKVDLEAGFLASYYNGLLVHHNVVDNRSWRFNSNTISLNSDYCLVFKKKFGFEFFIVSILIGCSIKILSFLPGFYKKWGCWRYSITNFSPF